MNAIDQLIADLANTHNPANQSAAREALLRIQEQPTFLTPEEQARIRLALEAPQKPEYDPTATQFWAPWN